MKEFTFTSYCIFGKGDSSETYLDVELTDEEAERLIKFGTQADIYYGEFSQCKELRDIYDRIYSIAVAQITEELRDSLEQGLTWIDQDEASNPKWKADDKYACGVMFPFEFEEMLQDE